MALRLPLVRLPPPHGAVGAADVVAPLALELARQAERAPARPFFRLVPACLTQFARDRPTGEVLVLPAFTRGAFGSRKGRLIPSDVAVVTRRRTAEIGLELARDTHFTRGRASCVDVSPRFAVVAPCGTAL